MRISKLIIIRQQLYFTPDVEEGIGQRAWGDTGSSEQQADVNDD